MKSREKRFPWNKELIEKAIKWDSKTIEIYRKLDTQALKRHFKLKSILGTGIQFPSRYPFHRDFNNLRDLEVGYQYNEEEKAIIDNWDSLTTYQHLGSDLTDQQISMVTNLEVCKYNIFNAARGVGVTYLYLTWLLKHLSNNSNKRVCVMLYNIGTVKETHSKFLNLIANRPFGLQPGTDFNGKTVKFRNGSSVKFVCTFQEVISQTWNIIIVDQFAYLSDKFTTAFVENVLPAMLASKNSRMLLVSVPNGFNTFYDLFTCRKYDYFNRETYKSDAYKKLPWIKDYEIRQEYQCEFLSARDEFNINVIV